jgi:hypothetical protein
MALPPVVPLAVPQAVFLVEIRVAVAVVAEQLKVLLPLSSA